ncbi:MAG: hypothetical protein L6R40_003063 [Gallowayella cf. fulva]|nr:MAG: hypothetical protein L6R40_003063 [Xanthomendoza cf. fulva]
MPAISAGKEVVVIMHSYSGGPGAMAAEGLSVAERHAAGQVGGVVGLIFISAFIAEEGQTLVSGGGFAPWPNGQLSVKNPKEVFYNGVPDSLANRAVHDLRDQARNSAVTPCGPPAWSNPFYNGRRAFVRCTLDNAIPPFAQDAMLQNSGVQWEIQDFATGHAPFLSQPRRLAMWTDRTIEKFQAVRNEDTVATA